MWRLAQRSLLLQNWLLVALGVLAFPLALHHRDLVYAVVGLVLIAFAAGMIWLLRRTPLVEDYPESERRKKPL